MLPFAYTEHGSETDEYLLKMRVLKPKGGLLCSNSNPRYIYKAVNGQGDGELVVQLQRRDPDALGTIYDHYGQIVYSLFLRITRDATVAEDLVQELLLRIWNHSRDFDVNKGSLDVWIVSIARNMAIDYVRSAEARFASRLRPLDHAERGQTAGGGKNPESLVDQTRIIHTAFEQLNANQKRVLELAYFEGCSQTEIADRLNEPLGTVKSWMRSGLMRLRAAIKEDAAL